jgi:hypothetical protein
MGEGIFDTGVDRRYRSRSMGSRTMRAAVLLAAALALACAVQSGGGGAGYPGYPGGAAPGYPGYPGGGLPGSERDEAIATCARHAERVARPDGARDVDLDRLVSVQPQGGRIDVLAYYAIDYRTGRSIAYGECRVDRSPWRVLSFRWDDSRPPGPPGGDDLERARDGCRAEVERSGYAFRRFTGVTPGDRTVAVEMDARRGNASFEAACSYERRSGKTRITRVTEQPAGGDDFVKTAVGICKREANQRRLSVKGILAAVPERDGARIDFDVRIDNRKVRAVCRVSRDGRVDFDL